MSAMKSTGWHQLPTSLKELCIDTTLRCGQSFRWRRNNDTNEWSLALHGRIVTLRQDSTHLHWRALFPTSSKKPTTARSKAALPTPPPSSPASIAASDSQISPKEEQEDDTLTLITHYLNLGPSLAALYAQWSASDPNFARKAAHMPGIRILRQDAWEALVGFICSSNNNIARISQMVAKLCAHWGTHLGDVEGVQYHDFPGPERLTGPNVESRLRELGFGYRAKYIAATAKMVVENGGVEWLEGLRNPDAPSYTALVTSKAVAKTAADAIPPSGGREGYRAAHEQLLTLQGVGPKVADCVSLMGLGWGEAVPVDTHVWQIAVRDYKFGGKGASKKPIGALSKPMYDAVGDKFRALWGMEAGWAHSVLFTADLRAFAEQVVGKVERVEVKEEEKSSDESVVREVTKKQTLTKKRVKAEWEDGEHNVVEMHEDMVSRVKRRRRGGQ